VNVVSMNPRGRVKLYIDRAASLVGTATNKLPYKSRIIL
jgi:hypothetical protein